MTHRHDPLKDLRISRPAVAKILWHAIEAGADTGTLRAICDYITDPSAVATTGIDMTIYENAASEADRAARRSAAARAAAQRRRESRSCLRPPAAAQTADPPAPPSDHDLEIERQIKEYVREINAPFGSIAHRRRWGLL